jgi:hypothetical protein
MDTPYISQHQPLVFIKGYWLDDAQSCEWQVSDPREPLYGYADQLFRDVAEGQTLVHGMLDINFRWKGYLHAALTEIDSQTLDFRSGGDTFDQAGIDPRRVPVAGYRAYLEKAYQEFDIPGFQRLSRGVQAEFWDPAQQEDRPNFQGSLARRPARYPNPFDLTIVFDPSDPADAQKRLDPQRVETIRGVRIMAQSKMIVNAVPGGGQALIERYQFIAQDVV